MSTIDWIVLCGFTGFIVFFGIWKTHKTKNTDEYLRAGKTSSWWVVALSIMATQASAITFLSTPGQAYVDGMRFVQFYIGLPIAMIILSITAVPVYSKLNVFTAYEYLEIRFDLKNRILGSVLFLTQRGLAAGFTIYAPALILSVILGWNIHTTIILMGLLVILYTTIGGSSAVNKTHILQMIIITAGMFTAFFMIIAFLSKEISFINAAHIAGKMGKLNVIDFSFNLSDRYTFWSGLIGGTFLMLSYFGTDQSQVARYLAARNITQSRMGLLVNGLVKVPMQFVILFIGAMVFVFFQFVTPPLFFNPVETKNIKSGNFSEQYIALEQEYGMLHLEKKNIISEMVNNNSVSEISYQKKLLELEQKGNQVRDEAKLLIKKNNPSADLNDTNYIFITYIVNYLPLGLIGLLLAAILAASMSSTSAELNSLSSTTMVDIYKRLINKNGTDEHYLKFSKLATVGWGFYAIIFALFANELGSLIEAVNILGSLVYGTILGIFLTAFYTKKITGHSVFFAAIISELVVLYSYFFTDIPFLWYNVIGCILVFLISSLINPVITAKTKSKTIR